MEDILDLYQLPYDPAIPMVCMDEKPYQLLGDAREPLPMRQGSCAKLDSEYVRGGTASIFLFCEALAPWCHVTALPRRTALDWAAQIKELLTVHYPDAPLIRLVMDNLNTHTTASLYKAFPAAEARALARRLEIHYTPKHGSWLNIANAGGIVFSSGLLLALPIVVTLLITNIALGVLGRVAPQLNLMAIGFPVTIVLGFVALIVGMANDLLAKAPDRAVGGSGGSDSFGRRKASGTGSLGGLGV